MAGTVQEPSDGLRDLRLSGLAALRCKVLAGVVPGQLAERGGYAAQVLPGGGDPPTLMVVAHSDLADVVGVVVNFPQ